MSEVITKASDITPPLYFDSEEAFEAWCNEDTRAEYLDGEVIMHSPASFEHETFLPRLTSIMEIYVEEKDLGVICGSNFQFRLRSGRRRMADLSFVSTERLHVVHENYIDGAPDLVVEVVSPESADRDWYDKYSDYEAAGVLEYLIIDFSSRRVAFYRLGRDDRFAPVAEQNGRLYSQCLPGFWFKPEWFWQRPMPNVLPILREIGLFK
jgi:Uma2 family endonuclease